MGRIIEADGAMAAAERVSAALRRVTILAVINVVLTAVLLGIVIALDVVTWR